MVVVVVAKSSLELRRKFFECVYFKTRNKHLFGLRSLNLLKKCIIFLHSCLFHNWNTSCYSIVLLSFTIDPLKFFPCEIFHFILLKILIIEGVKPKNLFNED